MREIAIYFLRLGCIGFGGPLSLVAQMQKDLIEERKWIPQQEFVQSLALIKAMPGALAFSTAAYLGTRRGGFWGGTIAGWCLVLPAFCMMLVLAQVYEQVSQVTWVTQALAGMQAAALALIALSIRGLMKGYERNGLFWVLVAAGLVLLVGEIPEPVLILAFGVLSLVILKRKKSLNGISLLSVTPLSFFGPELKDLFLICFKAGAVVFGTGLAAVPILEADIVEKMSWLNHSQFMDALAFGQMTPGPVLVTVTFVGYKVSGLAGAVVATFGVFLPSYFHMTTWFPRLTGWLSRQTWVSSFILGALAAVIATLALTVFKLCRLSTGPQLAILIGFLLLNLKWKVPSWAVIALGALAGVLLV
jgi:chromate transporter